MGFPTANVAEYRTLLCQCFSASGTELAVADDRGFVAVFSVSKFRDNSEDTSSASGSKALLVKFRASSPVETSPFSSLFRPVLSMCSSATELIIGCAGEISAWPWKDIGKRSPRKSWSIRMKPQAGAAVETEPNWMVLDESHADSTAGRLIVAGGDNCVHVYDLETRREISALQGHSNYLHSVSYCRETDSIASASEDGTVRLWDAKKKKANVATITPSERPTMARPSLGKWVGAVSMTQDWIACGGGVRAALWHLRTLAPSEPLAPLDAAVHVAEFATDRIIVAGETDRITGDIVADVPVSSKCVYSVAYVEEPVKMLAVVGSSAWIDICSPNFSYKQQSILFPA